MSRPSEVSTKIVSVRLPMLTYIRLLTEAYEQGVSVSEYLLLKIEGPAGPLQDGTTRSVATAEKPAALQLTDLDERTTTSSPQKPLASKAKERPALIPALTVQERRAALRQRISKLGRQLGGLSGHGKFEKMASLEIERDGLLQELASIKGKRK